MRLVEILSHSNKIKTIDDFLNHFDLIVELARADIYKIAKSKRIYFYDFDFTYADSVEILRSQLQKSHLKSIGRFLKCENISSAVSWLIERLLNNMRNITSNQKYKLYCAPDFGQLHENIKSNDELEVMFEVMKLEKIDRDTLKKGLQEIWKNSIFDEDFDYIDFTELCEKYGFEADDVVESHASTQIKFKKYQVGKNYQLELII